MHILLIGLEPGRWGTARLILPLREAGFRVVTLSPHGNALAHSSHAACAEILRPSRSIARLERQIAAIMARHAPALVIPADEMTIACLHAMLRRAAAGRSPLGAAAHAVLARSMGPAAMFDAKLMKSETQRLARALGLRVPAGATVRGMEEALARGAEIGFPLYAKSSFSWAGQGVTFCADAAALRAALSRAAPRNPLRAMLKRALRRDWYPTGRGTMDVQQAIAGAPAMYCAVCLDGEILGGFGGIAERTLSATGPSSIVALGPHAAMRAAAATMIRALGASGFIGFDFMLARETGQEYLLECNARPIQIGHLARRLGTDLCAALLSGLRGAPASPGAATVSETIALFPQEFQRNGTAPGDSPCFVDVPWRDPGLLAFMLDSLPGGIAGGARGPVLGAPPGPAQLAAWRAAARPACVA